MVPPQRRAMVPWPWGKTLATTFGENVDLEEIQQVLLTRSRAIISGLFLHLFYNVYNKTNHSYLLLENARFPSNLLWSYPYWIDNSLFVDKSHQSSPWKVRKLNLQVLQLHPVFVFFWIGNILKSNEQLWDHPPSRTQFFQAVLAPRNPSHGIAPSPREEAHSQWLE